MNFIKFNFFENIRLKKSTYCKKKHQKTRFFVVFIFYDHVEPPPPSVSEKICVMP